MITQKLKIKSGADYIRNKHWAPMEGDRAYAERLGDRRMPADLKICGFSTVVSDCDTHYRISYGYQKELK